MSVVNPVLNYVIGNTIARSDSYKVGHWLSNRPGLRKFYSYLEARGYDKHHGVPFTKTTLFGLQYQLMNYWEGPIVTHDHIKEAEEDFKLHFPYQDRSIFNREGWELLVNKFGGRLPLSVKAIPEGTMMGFHNALVTSENTDYDFSWLTNYLESDLMHIWYPNTVATQSREFYMSILAYLYLSGTPSTIHQRLHDFGYRGVTCNEQAAIGGAAHLAVFKGTDNIPALRFVRAVYGERMAGYSIFATEHGNMTHWGDKGNARIGEPRAMQAVLDANPTGPVACVSDTFGIYEACKHLWGQKFKKQILSRNGTLVVRPDSSGKTKDGKYESPAEVTLNVCNILWEAFGGIVNKKGYRVLDPHISTILGDGVDYPTHIDVMQTLVKNKFSVDNSNFGSGGVLLQKMSRDTHSNAFKGSYAEATGGLESGYTFNKSPYHIGKESMLGRLKVIRGVSPATQEEVYATVPEDCNESPWPNIPTDGKDQLTEVFCNGEILVRQNWADIRRRMLPSVAELSRVADRLGLPALDYARDEYFGTSQQS